MFDIFSEYIALIGVTELAVTSLTLLSVASWMSSLSFAGSIATVDTLGTVIAFEFIVRVSPASFPIVVFPFAETAPDTVSVVRFEAPVTVRLEAVVSPVTFNVVPTVAAPVTPTEARVVAPVTPSVVPTVAAPVTPRLASVVAPVTPRVVPTVAAPVTPKLANVEAPVTPRVVPMVAAPLVERLESEAAPVTASVLATLVAPVRVEVPVTERLPGIARLPLRLVAPVTVSVPPTTVLPLAAATVSLLDPTLKSPVVLTAVVDSWSAESIPLPSPTALRTVVSAELSELFSRPVYVDATLLPVSGVPISVLR